MSSFNSRWLAYAPSAATADEKSFETPKNTASKTSKSPETNPAAPLEPAVEHAAPPAPHPYLQRPTALQLHGDLLLNLMVWVCRYQELRIEHPNGLTLAAKPEHVRDALELHTWGLVYDVDRRVLVSWGPVPTAALLDKRDLATNEPLVRETGVAA